eukprot:532977-Pelagomonas_calceolata.AAC.2
MLSRLLALFHACNSEGGLIACSCPSSACMQREHGHKVVVGTAKIAPGGLLKCLCNRCAGDTYIQLCSVTFASEPPKLHSVCVAVPQKQLF